MPFVCLFSSAWKETSTFHVTDSVKGIQYNYTSMLEFMLIHVSKRGSCCHLFVGVLCLRWLSPEIFECMTTQSEKLTHLLLVDVIKNDFNFQTHFSYWYHEYWLENCFLVNFTKPHWWKVNFLKRHKSINWANANQEQCRHTASLGRNGPHLGHNSPHN